jgi:POT family proton-dependent oligopeptide transporter
MKSTMSAMYLLGISLGNLVVGLINGNIVNKGFFSQFTGAKYYWMFLVILACLLYCSSSSHDVYRRKVM